jgi:tRNA (guanine-N7-)-methyltransferase
VANPMTMDDIIVDAPAIDEVVDPAMWFATPGQVELEIGSGKGGFLLRRAQANPEKRLIGIEWANKYYKYAADRMARWGMTNVRMLRMDASDFVQRNLPANTLTSLFVFHPDPWPKRRHNIRRLIQTPFVDAAFRVLKPGGHWAIQTDHAEYFEQIRDLVTAHRGLCEIPFDDLGLGAEQDSVQTNFEIKYLREGRPIYRLATRKHDG